jgi:hypothetical protein
LIDAKNKSTLDPLFRIYDKLKMAYKATKVKNERAALGD